MPNLDLIITLRCNANCKNCIELCGMEATTGLDYSDSDMSLPQIDSFIAEVRGLNRRNLFDHVYLTGGEPLVHPHLEEIVHRLEPLVAENYIKHLHINSNMLIPAPPSIAHYVVNFSLPKDKPQQHNVVLVYPSEFGGKTKTRSQCTHYRKDTHVLTYQGFSLCCAGDAYVRLFGRDDLILDHLPASVDEFPNMDEICIRCPFSNDELLPLEKNVGCPVSTIYQVEAAKNKAGRQITKRYPGKVSKTSTPPVVDKWAGRVWPKITWVCCTFNRPKQLGHLIHCFLQQDYPADRKFLLILDDASQYENQKGDGWELISVSLRFATLGQKRNAATALVPNDTEIICPVDDDEMYLPHAMQAHATALEKGDWTKPSVVYEEKQPGVFLKEPYHGHSASWGYRREIYQKTTGYSFINRGEDGGLQVQLESPKVRVVDPLKFGFEPYMLCSRFQQYHTHNFGPGDYEQIAQKVLKGKVQLKIAPGYKIANGRIVSA